MPGPFAAPLRQRVRVLVGSALPDQRHEGIAPGCVEVGRLPVHPLVYPCSGFWFGRVQVHSARPVRQVADDRVGLPQHESVVIDYRYLRVGVQRCEIGGGGVSEARAPVVSFEGSCSSAQVQRTLRTLIEEALPRRWSMSFPYDGGTSPRPEAGYGAENMTMVGSAQRLCRRSVFGAALRPIAARGRPHP